MKVVTYSRVSTEDQSTAAQLIELRNVALQRGWTVVGEFEDVISGTKKNRPALDKLLARVREGGIEAVVAVKIDRLGRSLANFLSLAEEFRKHGTAIICTSQGIDTTSENPCGVLMQNMLAAFAQFERSLIVDRTKAGLKAAKARGVVLGRPSNKMPNEASRIAIVDKWREEGGPGGYEELGRRLGGVSRSTAMRVEKKTRDTPVEEAY